MASVRTRGGKFVLTLDEDEMVALTGVLGARYSTPEADTFGIYAALSDVLPSELNGRVADVYHALLSDSPSEED